MDFKVLNKYGYEGPSIPGELFSFQIVLVKLYLSMQSILCSITKLYFKAQSKLPWFPHSIAQFYSAKLIILIDIIWFQSIFPYWVALYRRTHLFTLLKTSSKDWFGGLSSLSCLWYTSLKLGARILSSPLFLAHRKPSSMLSRQFFILQRAPSCLNTMNAKLSKKGKHNHFGKCKVAKIFLVGLMYACRHILCFPFKTCF